MRVYADTLARGRPLGVLSHYIQKCLFCFLHHSVEKNCLNERVFNWADVYAICSVAKMNIKSKEIGRMIISQCGHIQ